MRSRLLLGGGALAATAVLSLAINGVATSSLSGGLVTTPRAAAQELAPFGDCDELLQWYVDQALPEVGPWGFGHGLYVDELAGFAMRDMTGATAMAGATDSAAVPVSGTAQATAPDASVSSSETGTNVQEAGVDEPDRAKTADGLVVHVREGRTLVVTDVTGSSPREVGTLRLPRTLEGAEVLLDGDTVLVVGSTYPRWGGPGWGGPVFSNPTGRLAADMILPGPMMMEGQTQVLAVSLADPGDPRITSDQTFGGQLLSARQYADPAGGADVVRFVVRTGTPPLDFVYPNRNRTEAEAERANKQIVRDSTLEDWLPTVRVDGGDPEPLVACDAVLHPRTGSGLGTISVVTAATDAPEDLASTAVTAGGETVYSSTDRLYLATTPWSARGPARRTEVHAFALDGSDTDYLGSGEVDGVVKDRWSMDAVDGYLRIAVAHGKGWSPTENGITVLAERDGGLVQVGAVRGLGPDEEIKSVRWFDDLAVVVTFRQTDPLYTVDLSDPSRPRTLGELKIPGFSTYLHPVGDDRLLGVGVDASLRGEVRGGQVSLFDVSDLRDPVRQATLGLGRHSRPVVEWEPRAFTWLGTGAGAGTALIAVNDDWDGVARMVAVTLGADGSLAETTTWRLPRWNADIARALPLEPGIVALVDDEVRVVDVP